MNGYRSAQADQDQSACPYQDKRKPSGGLSWSRSFIKAWLDGLDVFFRKH